jgi:hypothetical protein
MPDYKNSKIYTIRCRDDPTLIYVGSTTQQLSQRWQDHKDATKSSEKHKKYNYKVYQEIRDKGIDLFYIELYEEYPCENKNQLHKREGEITRLVGTLNSRIAGRNKHEYYIENKDCINQKVREYMKGYNENKKEIYKECRK